MCYDSRQEYLFCFYLIWIIIHFALHAKILPNDGMNFDWLSPIFENKYTIYEVKKEAYDIFPSFAK
jgi:hypothetical protein